MATKYVTAKQLLERGLVITEDEHNVPNLDAMPEGEVRKFFNRYKDPTPRQAARLVGKKIHFTSAIPIAKQLAEYARMKSAAMRMRRKGDIANATLYEDSLDYLYKKLPAELRW